MNKKILLLLLIPILLISTTSCGNNSISKKNKEKIVFKDEELGYTTNLYYSKKDNFTDISQRISKPTTMTFTNKDLDIEFLMSYSTFQEKTYEASKKARKTQKYYQEYKLGKYKGYTYGNSEETVNMCIFLKKNKKNEIVLNITLTRLDDNRKIIAKEVVDNKKVQDILKSIEFTLDKKK